MAENNLGITDPPEVRILLIGKTGVGKSASGNTVLGDYLFHSEQSSCSVTTECVKQSVDAGDRRITVIDTPDVFYNTQEENLSSEIKRSISLASPGVHAVLYVLPLTTFTDQEADYVSLCKGSFGEEAFRFTVVLFTHGDKLSNKAVETVIEENSKLQGIVNECGGRYHVLNNNDHSNRDQVTRLLEKIDRMIEENDDLCYTIEMLQEVERRKHEQLSEEEMEKIKHERLLEKVKTETEEQLRKEWEPQLERLRTEIQAEKEAMERTREHREREKRNRGISNSEEWIRKTLSQLNQNRWAISVIFIFTMGGFHVYNTTIGSGKLEALGECLLGVLPMFLGAVPARAWIFMRRKMSKPVCLSWRKKVIGVMCGFAAGAIARYGIGGNSKDVLLAGLFGAVGAICFSSDNPKQL